MSPRRIAIHTASAELSTSGFGYAPCSSRSLRDLVVAVVDRRIERVTVRRDPLLGQIRIGAVLQEQADDLDVPAGRRVLERRAAADVVRAVVIDTVRAATDPRPSSARTRARSPLDAAIPMSTYAPRATRCR